MNRINRYTQFMIPIGGIIVIISFFLPWLQIGVHGEEITSGFGLAQNRVLLAIAFISGLVITCVSFYTLIIRKPWKARVLILVGTGIGLAMLLPEYLNFMQMARKIHLAINFGFWGAATGFMMTTVGTFLTETKSEEQSNVSVEEEQLWSVVHIGGFFALICFFIPWDGIGDGIDFSGIDLAKWNPAHHHCFDCQCCDRRCESIHVRTRNTLESQSPSFCEYRHRHRCPVIALC